MHRQVFKGWINVSINRINHYPSDNEFFCYQLLDSYLPQRWIALFTLRTTGDILSELNHLVIYNYIYYKSKSSVGALVSYWPASDNTSVSKINYKIIIERSFFSFQNLYTRRSPENYLEIDFSSTQFSHAFSFILTIEVKLHARTNHQRFVSCMVLIPVLCRSVQYFQTS